MLVWTIIREVSMHIAKEEEVLYPVIRYVQRSLKCATRDCNSKKKAMGRFYGACVTTQSLRRLTMCEFANNIARGVKKHVHLIAAGRKWATRQRTSSSPSTRRVLKGVYVGGFSPVAVFVEKPWQHLCLKQEFFFQGH